MPDKPNAPTTRYIHADTLTIVDWEAPFNQGSPITGYRIYVR
jgi:hypothetical protein